MKKLILCICVILLLRISVSYADDYYSLQKYDIMEEDEEELNISSTKVPFSFFYPYDNEYYYPEIKDSVDSDEQCYVRYEDGTLFYYCD